MKTHITETKYIWGNRQIPKLQKLIKAKEQELVITEGFFKRRAIKKDICRLEKQLRRHGQEITDYELQQANNN